jgi:serine/threonine-protein phosphatase 2B catalytic subunit
MLMALKIEYSSNIILLRGNHESRIMTQQYNFRQECCNKYSQSVYESILDVFNALPIACVVNREYFCVHGGISDKISQVTLPPLSWHKSTLSIAIRK